jgi:formate hydrogenlyase subunit 6/NADH:ubiquinone oxidoreductase subunit I
MSGGAQAGRVDAGGGDMSEGGDGMSETVKLTIDGKACSCEKGEFLLEVARRNGIFIPSLCFHEGLGGMGACRVCIVEVCDRGRTKVVVSCVYPVDHEIEVQTKSERVKEERGVILTLLNRLAPNSKTIAQMAKFMGADLPRLSPKEDGDTCILCGRCTTACELLGTGAIARINRGTTKEVATPYHRQSPECVGCGSCAHVCPTDSIPFERTETSFTIWGETFEFIRCDRCGTPFMTQKQFAYLRDHRAGPTEPLCENCAKQATATLLKASTKDFDAVRELLQV